MLERLETCSPVIPLFSPYKNARPLSCFIQNAVRTGAISQIQPDGQLPLENVFCIRPHSANLLHCRSPFLCLRARRTLGAYRIPRETGLLIPIWLVRVTAHMAHSTRLPEVAKLT